VRRIYTFDYASNWNKWVFVEFEEKRAPLGGEWRQSRHIMWYDQDEVPTVDIPSEVTEKLAEVTDADDVVLQRP
jgi:hypothetical protein